MVLAEWICNDIIYYASGAGCILICWLIQIYKHILGPENDTFLGNSWYYSFFLLQRFTIGTNHIMLLKVLNKLGLDNATFWGDSCYYATFIW